MTLSCRPSIFVTPDIEFQRRIITVAFEIEALEVCELLQVLDLGEALMQDDGKETNLCNGGKVSH